MAALSAAALFAMPASAAPLPRAASFGLCADQMLLMLADRGQVASVSDQARGPLSYYAVRARGVPANRGAAEEIIASGAKLLLVSESMDQRSAAALARFGVRLVHVPLINEWSQVERMTREIAAALDQRQKGEAVIADMRARLAKVRPARPRSQWPTAVYYRPDGGGGGAGSFVDTALGAAGFQNLQRKWGPPGWQGVPVERVVLDLPDLFVVSYFDTGAQSSSILRRNPVLWGKARTRPVLNVHGKYWNCGSPLLVHAVEQLAVERRRLMGKQRK